MPIDSLSCVVDAVIVAETVKVALDTVRIAGRVYADTVRWWPAAYAGFGALFGALGGAAMNYWFNSRLERERKVCAKAFFIWQKDVDAGFRALSSTLKYMSDVRFLRDMLADVPSPVDFPHGISQGHRETISRRFSQVRQLAVQTQQGGIRLSTQSLLPGEHFSILQSRLGAIQDHGMKFAESFTELARKVNAWLEGVAGKESSSVPSLRALCISECDRIVEETMKLYMELFAAVRPGAKIAEDGTVTWLDAE